MARNCGNSGESRSGSIELERRLKSSSSKKEKRDMKNSNELAKKPSANSNDNQKQTANSITNVNFSDYAAYSYYANQRVICSFRCDEGLWKHAKPIFKRVYGSICRGIEIYLANFIEATERGVYFSHTEKPLRIDKIVIERNLRPRRKLEIRKEVTVSEVVEDCCGFRGCSCVPVVATYRNVKSGIQKNVCSYHAKNLHEHPKWKVVSSG